MENTIVVFGCGREAVRFIAAWENQLNIEYCLDNYSSDNSNFRGYSVKMPTDENVKDKKIVITPAYYYDNIKNQLENMGLVESKNFWGVGDFLDYAELNRIIPQRETKTVGFVGFANNFNIYNNEFINAVSSKYKVVIDNENPRYVFCSVWGKPYEYLKYKGIRIFYSGENIGPDFNYVDYAICYNRDMHYEDRFFRELPFYGRKVGASKLQNLNEKISFCNFIYSHERDDEGRKIFFEKLSKYKRVDSMGTYLNNMPDGFTVTRMNKIAETRKYKFSIAFESIDMSGFITEKISDAFDAKTIPIYMGDPHVDEIFNREAFINVNDYPDFDAVIEKIIELDNDDEKYLEMVNKPVFNPSFDNMSKLEEMQEFVLHIFEQDYNKAFRRAEGPSKFVKGKLAESTVKLLNLSSPKYNLTKNI